MSHHGMNQPRGMKSAHRSNRFSSMFPNLPRLISDPADLIEAGKKDGPMDESVHGAIGSTNTPLGYVFLGQFIDHDITLDVTSSFDQINDPDAIRNFRTPTLDLDCIYGGGPEASRHLYYHAPPARRAPIPLPKPSPIQPVSPKAPIIPDNLGRFRDRGFRQTLNDIRADNLRNAEINGFYLLTDGDDLSRAFSHSEDNPNQAAIIGDPRNDENRIVSQLQLSMHYFHNAVYDHLLNEAKSHSSETPNYTHIFEEAQQTTRWHYQWVVVHDFLVRMAGQETVTDILANGTKFYCPEGQPFIPIEFAAAAYRFGHTMVASQLNYNDDHQNTPLFSRDLGSGFQVNQAGEIKWENFFGNNAVSAGAVDIRLSPELLKLPFVNGEEHLKSLATRNLLRGQSFGLPSGQNIYQAMVEELGSNLPQPDLAALNLPPALEANTPLWLYILAEGSLSNGQQLGPVGGRIIAEVLIGVLEKDPSSFLGSDRSWMPTLIDNPADWNMEALLQFASYGYSN